MDTAGIVGMSVAIGAVRESGTNPRKRFDEGKLAELAESIRGNGIVQALVVRPGDVEGEYILIAGERRLRAARLAGLAEVPVTVRECTAAEAAEVQLVENAQREDVTRLEEAEGFQRLIDEHGYDVARIAERVGKSKRYIYQRLQLLTVSAVLREAMESGLVTQAKAARIARLGESGQAEAVREIEERREQGRELSLRALDRWIKEELVLNLDAAAFPKDDAKLVKAAGTCVECPKRSGNQPDLCADMRSPNNCLDAECYRGKVAAHMARELKADPELVKIKRGYGYHPNLPKGTLADHQYKEIGGKTQRCGGESRAIVVSGAGVGQIVDVCANGSCKKHFTGGHGGGGSAYSKVEKSQAEKDEAREAKARIEGAKLGRGRILDAVLAKGPSQRLSADLELVAAAFWKAMGGELREIVRKRHPEWDADILPIGDLPEEGLVTLLIEFALARELQLPSWDRNAEEVPGGLVEAANAAGVNWAELAARASAEVQAPKVRGKKAAGVAGAEPLPRPFVYPLPLADEDGIWAREQCEVIEMPAPGQAALLLVRSPGGWRGAFEAQTESDGVYLLPEATQKPSATREEAMGAAIAELMEWTAAIEGSKKNRAQARKIAEWAQAQGPLVAA